MGPGVSVRHFYLSLLVDEDVLGSNISNFGKNRYHIFLSAG